MRCDYRWPLIEPSPEDAAAGITHHCRLDQGHPAEVEHQCACGSKPGDEW